MGAFERVNLGPSGGIFAGQPIRADSMYVTNPGFERFFSPIGRGEYNNFENSWGLSGGVAPFSNLISTVKWEVGFSWQQIGAVQY